MLALEEIYIAPRKINEIKVKEINVNELVNNGLIKEEEGFLYLTDKGIRRLMELRGIMDELQRIYMSIASGKEIKQSEVRNIEQLILDGYIIIDDDKVTLTFEGIKLVAQRIAEKMTRGH
ncbi:hypothetical protein CM19_10825 [Candidatus Acidianus copahuensis]|uniref:Uncharacterized protein n=2 Tax=Sulfolobaceae TaxID=118883 RepID=A0A031LKF5_9CREN|nr:hypothetical protein CM19_10825 [Candidatus Acidianus copahuensis]